MPSYTHLLETAIDFDKVTDRVWAAHMLGASYDHRVDRMRRERLASRPKRIAADIVSQGGPVMTADVLTLDSQAVALIAFLQRIGTDIFAPPPGANKVEPAASPGND